MLVVSNLAELAGLINTAHQNCRSAFEVSQEQAHSSLTYAKEAGQWLNQARAMVQEGEWLLWLEANTELKKRTAQAYMQIDREWEQLSELPGFNRLNYSTALALLGKLNQPEEPEVVEGELVEEQPTPKPQRFEVGEKAVVAKPSNLHAGETVEIIGKKGQVLIGVTPSGQEYPFMPAELRHTTDRVVSAPEPHAAATPRKRLTEACELLERCRSYVPGNLQTEIADFLAS